MTPKDRDLLALLRLNARESVSALARKLGTSRSTVQDRIRRLEESGAIAGYTVVMGADQPNEDVRALVTIVMEPRRTVEVVSALKKLSSVDALHTVSGKFDLAAMVRTGSPSDMDRVLDDIGAIGGVVRTESAIILSTKLDRR